MVIAATILIVNNLDILLGGVNRLGNIFQGQLPAIRTAIAYPGAAKGRTGMTIAMFSLIVFSLVMIATMNQNFTNLLLGDEANAGWDVRADAFSADPVPDFTGTLAANGVDTNEFTATGVVHAPTEGVSGLRLAGGDDSAWKEYSVRGMDAGFIAGSTLSFGQRAVGYDSDAAIIEALRTQPDVAIVDVNAVPDGDIGEDADAFFLEGLSGDDKTFDPVGVELIDPRDGSIHAVTIIGVIDEKLGSLVGLYANDAAVGSIYGEPAVTSYYVALSDPDRADAVAKEIEAALMTSGVQGTSIQDDLEEGQRQSNGFLYIIEGFMGLGLVVGIAAVGVIAFRSVVERRQQIGVLRAIGFQRSAVATSFMIETAFLVGLGGFAGTVLGLVLARNLFTSDDVGSSEVAFVIPWGILAVIVVLTNVAALVTTWIPARQAGRIAPAEALRYE
jgi:putative ABC transport system permease protein